MTETPRDTVGSSTEFRFASAGDPVQLHGETLLTKASSLPCSLLRCPCGSVFGLLSLFMSHLRESGHFLLGAKTIESKSPPNPGGFGQKILAKQGHDVPPYVPQCFDCGRLFQSLPELTLHMIQMAHYLNLVHSNVIYHRPSSVCSASTLDSYDGNENSGSEQSGYDLRPNVSTVWSEFPGQAQTSDFSWSGLLTERLLSGLGPIIVDQKNGDSGKTHDHSKGVFPRGSMSRTQADQSKRNFATVKIEADDRVVPKSIGRSSNFGSEGRSCYSSPSIKTYLETTENGADSNLNRPARNVFSTTRNSLYARQNENQNTDKDVSALTAMQNFVQRSFGLNKDFEHGSNSIGRKRSSFPDDRLNPNLQWQVPKSNCETSVPAHTSAYKRRKRGQVADLNVLSSLDTRPDTSPKRKGVGKSRNLAYWKNLAVDSKTRNNMTRERTSESLRKQRITAWQCSSTEQFDNLTSNVIRPSSVDGILLAKRRAGAVEELLCSRKRHRSLDCRSTVSVDELQKYGSNNLAESFAWIEKFGKKTDAVRNRNK